MGIFWLIIIGLLAGWLATQTLGGRGGSFYNLAVGLVGAIAGGFHSKSSTCRSCPIFGAIDYRHHRRHHLLLIWRNSKGLDR